MSDNSRSVEFEAFEHTLEAYGADESRWPEQARRRFAPLQARDVKARALLAEARALDRLLSRAPLLGQDRTEALKQRILAAAAHAPKADQTPSGRVIQLEGRRPRKLPASHISSRSAWKVAAVLAASLVAGVFLGRAQPLRLAIQTLAESTMLSADNDKLALVMFDDSGAWPGSWDDEEEL